MKRAWLSQDDLPERVTKSISLPDNELWDSQFLGALLLLTEVENWQQHGALTPAEMAEYWRSVFFDYVEGLPLMLPIGTTLEFSGDTLPDDFLWEDGSEISRTEYAQLFAVIGEIYGDGDGATTFNLPNHKQRVAAGYDAGNGFFDELGKTGGNEWQTLTIAQLPVHTHVQNSHNHNQNSHNHSQNAHNHTIDGGINAAAGAVGRSLIAVNSGSNNTVSRDATATNIAVTATNIAATATNQNAGSGEMFEIMQPYIVKNFIIKYR